MSTGRQLRVDARGDGRIGQRLLGVVLRLAGVLLELLHGVLAGMLRLLGVFLGPGVELVRLAVDPADRLPLLEDFAETLARSLPVGGVFPDVFGFCGQGFLARDGLSAAILLGLIGLLLGLR